MSHPRTMRFLWLLPALLVACVDGGRESPDGPTGEASAPRLAFEAPAGTLAPRLQATEDGALVLSWIQRRPEQGSAALRYAVLERGAWSSPTTVVERDDLFVNWADTPGVVRDGSGNLWAWWLQMAGEGTYAYHVQVASSADGGESWSEPARLHEDDGPVEHGFVSVRTGSQGLAAVWLDGRQMREGRGGDMELRFRAIGPGEIRGPEALLDTRVCECCATDLVSDGRGGYLVAYRDRSDEEIRDIAVARKPGLLPWSEPAPLSQEGWVIRGCPVNGPALAVAAGWSVAAWFTSEGGEPRVLAAFSEDGGETWRDALRLDGGSALGRVDLVALADESARVIWMEGAMGEAEIRLRTLRPDTPPEKARVLARTGGMRASGFPRLALHRGRLWLAWTHTEEGATRVRAGPVENLEEGP